MAEVPEAFHSTTPLAPWWYLCRDIACPCNLQKCQRCEDFIMALRRNPQRCCQERYLSTVITIKPQSVDAEIRENNTIGWEQSTSYQLCTKRQTIKRRKDKIATRHVVQPTNGKPFPFFKLPREIRDQVYANLVVAHNSCGRSIIPAAALLSGKKARAAAQAKRERLNQKRISSGRPPIRERHIDSEPIVHLNLLQASQQLHNEAKDYLYSNNWFAITLNKLPLNTFEIPHGWDLSRIKKLQMELQLKNAAHMNNYVDWESLFAPFTSLRFLRIVPTFHPRYYDWAHTEMLDWPSMHYIHKAFFRELINAIPRHMDVKLGSSPRASTDMHLQGKPLDRALLGDICAEFGPSQINQPFVMIDHAMS
ncbi:hypothetical protein GQ44DRAFT_721732 [Phaeosphaeriaceae sp. PMI808]|nr:hypothetical protein GQ44DRAFT_721732 [Phaeosphaeriaceae sp. PMI808]